MPVGRPLSVGAERRRAIAEVLDAGATVKATAAATGIPLRTLTRWLQTGAVARPPAHRQLATPPQLRPEPESSSLDELLNELRSSPT